MTILISDFYDSIINNTDRYYAYIGSPDKNYTPTLIHDDVLLLKRIVASDVSYSINRHDWKYGGVYTQYDYAQYNTGTLKGKNFYACVYTDGVFKVFKCINNNMGGISTVSPATIARKGMVTLDDNYTWMYMYQFSNNLFKKFATLDYLPFVEDTVVTAYATPTTIDNIQLLDNGYGYTTCSAIITGDGGGASAIVELLDTKVHRVIVTSVGTGYTNAMINFIGDGVGASASVVIAPSGGQGAHTKDELFATYLTLAINMSTPQDYIKLPYGVQYSSYGLLKNVSYANDVGDTSVDYVFVNNGGTGYRLENKPILTFSGGFDSGQVTAGTNYPATAKPSMSDTSITTAIVTYTGDNYRTVPTVVASGGAGSGSSLTAIMKANSIKNYSQIKIHSTDKSFRVAETIRQGVVTAQVLFHDTINNVIGLYNIDGTFVNDTLVEGVSSGVSSKTILSGSLNTPNTSFTSSDVVASYTNTTITRQLDQPEHIVLTLSF